MCIHCGYIWTRIWISVNKRIYFTTGSEKKKINSNGIRSYIVFHFKCSYHRTKWTILNSACSIHTHTHAHESECALHELINSMQYKCDKNIQLYKYILMALKLLFKWTNNHLTNKKSTRKKNIRKWNLSAGIFFFFLQYCLVKTFRYFLICYCC